MRLLVESFGLDLAGLQRRVTGPGWFARAPTWIHVGTRRLMASHADSPSVPSSSSAGKPSTPLGGTRFLCAAVFGFFIYNTVGEACC